MNKWMSVRPIEVALICHLLFDAGILDVNWLVRKNMLVPLKNHWKVMLCLAKSILL